MTISEHEVIYVHITSSRQFFSLILLQITTDASRTIVQMHMNTI